MDAIASPFGTQSLTNLQHYVVGYLRGYALRTQVRPKPVDELVEGLYDGLFSSRESRRLRRRLLAGEEESINDVVQECFEGRGYRLVVRDETGSSSLAMRGQLPSADIPTGDVMDLPLYAYLRSEGVSGSFALRIHNALLRGLPDSRSYAMRLASRRLQGLEPGYAYSGVLTLGGAFALLSEEGLGSIQHSPGIGAKVTAVLLTYVLDNAKVKELAKS